MVIQSHVAEGHGEVNGMMHDVQNKVQICTLISFTNKHLFVVTLSECDCVVNVKNFKFSSWSYNKSGDAGLFMWHSNIMSLG